MAVDFVQKNRKQKYLLFIVVGLAVVTFIILWFGYFNKAEELPGQESVYIIKKNIRIEYETLESPLLKELSPFESAPLYEGDMGRENPFIKP